MPEAILNLTLMQIMLELGVKGEKLDDARLQRKFDAFQRTADRLGVSVGSIALMTDAQVAAELAVTLGSRVPLQGLRAEIHKWLLHKTEGQDA